MDKEMGGWVVILRAVLQCECDKMRMSHLLVGILGLGRDLSQHDQEQVQKGQQHEHNEGDEDLHVAAGDSYRVDEGRLHAIIALQIRLSELHRRLGNQLVPVVTWYDNNASLDSI